LQRVYASAVWIEKKKEKLGVIPACWIDQDYVFFPSTPTRPIQHMILDCEDEGRHTWLKFPLVKVKHVGGKHCDVILLTFYLSSSRSFLVVLLD
jgi:hypothetical protein